jgi:hypothetical protein
MSPKSTGKCRPGGKPRTKAACHKVISAPRSGRMPLEPSVPRTLEQLDECRKSVLPALTAFGRSWYRAKKKRPKFGTPPPLACMEIGGRIAPGTLRNWTL